MADTLAAEQYGAPRRMVVQYHFGDTIKVRLQWFEKDASRIPEAIFFGFNLDFENQDSLIVTKLGLPVKPYRVCDGGNKKLHGVFGLQYDDVSIDSLHAPLVSVGGRHLYDSEDEYGSIEDGVHYLLYNNRWDTNFPLWYGENATFDFCISFLNH